MKKILAALLLIVAPRILPAQCQVVINEIMFSPPTVGGNSIYYVSQPDSTAEWVELYNPSPCTPVDISCWVLGSDETNLSVLSTTPYNYGVFVFPAGTVIPPLGFIVVGGIKASPETFDAQTSSNYCGSTRWFMANADGWVALYTKTGTVVDAVYWSSTGSSSLNSSPTYTNGLNSHFIPACTCSGTTINSTAAKSIAGIEYAGTSSGALGQGWKRTSDGASTWASETPAQATPLACNGACAQPLAASIAGTNPGCGGVGSATVAATNGVPPYSYSWSNGQTTASASGLSGGTYTCTVTDGCGCTKTLTVTIAPAPSPFTVNVAQNNVLCNGAATGSATATPVGATGPFTYTWSTSPAQNASSASGLAAGIYTVTVSNGGCVATQTVSITQPTAVTASTNSSPSMCGASNGSATVTASGGTGPYTYLWSPGGSTSSIINNVAAGNYSVTVTDAHGCVKGVSLTISNSNSNITIAASVTPATCQAADGSATASPSGGATPYTYSWSSTPVQSTQTASSLLAGLYTVTVTDNNGCISTQTVNVGVQGGLTASVTATNEICAHANGSATVTVSGGTSPYTYLWTPGGNTTPNIQNVTAGNYSVVVNDANGCSQTATVTVVNTTPNIVIAATSTPATCQAANGSATAVPSGGVSPYIYSWSTSPAQSTQIASNLLSGMYTVTITDNNGCIATQIVNVGVQGGITANATASDETCGQSNGTATVTVNGGASPYNYSWTCTPVQTTSVVTGLPAGTYSVTINDANGCVTSTSVSLGNITNIGAHANSSPALCTSSNGSATVTTTSGATPFTFAWSSGQTTQTINSLSPGNYSCVVTDNLGCSITVTVAVTGATQTVSATFTSTPAVCTSLNGSTTVLPSNGTAPYTYLWNTGASSQTISGLAHGTYSVLITDANGCTGTLFATIPAATATFNLTSSTSPAVCTNSSGTASVTASGGTAPYVYNWSNMQNTPGVTGLSAGNYSVQITDQNGCDTTISMSVGQVYDSLQISSTVQDETCGHSNGSISLQVNGGTAPYSYVWSNGVSAQNNSPVPAGTYIVAVTDANGCTGGYQTTVSNLVSISFSFATVDDRCNASKASVTAVPSSGSAPFSYNWSTGATTSDINGVPAGTYTVTVADALGCALTQTVTVNNQDDIFNGSVAGSSDLQQDEAGSVWANMPGNWSIEYWISYDGDTVHANNIPLYFAYPAYGDYDVTLCVMSTNGCKTSVNFPIYVEPSWTFYISNAFSPNEDGLNDSFSPKHTGVTELKGWIYDRWGEKVYTFSSLADSWDGKLNGNTVQQDTYTYSFIFKDLKGQTHTKNGTVNVIR